MERSFFKRKGSIAALILIPVTAVSVFATFFLSSGIYRWDETDVVKSSYGWSREMLNSPTRSLEMFTIKAFSLLPGKGLQSYNVEPGADEMFIIKEGTAELTTGKKTVKLPAGSVAVLAQGEKIQIRNTTPGNTVFYLFRFRTGAKSQKKIAPFIAVWDTLTFRASANGGRRNIINQETSALKNLEIHVTTLKEGLPSHAAHTHPDEEIILIRKGTSEESIKEIFYTAGPGSAVFLSNDDPHGIRNAGKGECEYYAIRWITETTTRKN